MSAQASQMALFSIPVDERTLRDEERAVLEAIDRLGHVTVPQAGRVVYQLRGYRTVILIPRAWLCSVGSNVLARLERHELVKKGKRGRWQRAASNSSSDLIGPERSEGPSLAPWVCGHAGYALQNKGFPLPSVSALSLLSTPSRLRTARGELAGVESYDWRRTACPSPALVAGPVEGTALPGDDGRVGA